MSKESSKQLLISWYTREEYERKYNGSNVPMLVKYTILAFCKQCIGCSWITMKEDMLFLNALCTKLNCDKNTIKFKSAYKGCDYNFSSKEFHKRCDKLSDNIVLIKSNHGNIFGGFTTKPWKNEDDYFYNDIGAFLFLIRSDVETVQARCPIIFSLKSSERKFAICCMEDAGPIFGSGWDIYISDKCDKLCTNPRCQACKSDMCCSKLSSFYNPDVPDDFSICGGEEIADVGHAGELYLFRVKQYEVIQVIH